MERIDRQCYNSNHSFLGSAVVMVIIVGALGLIVYATCLAL